MNETDVREELVRPLIRRLGYEFGTDNDVRTERFLTYNQRVLGLRKSDSDHRMSGRADYVCDVVSHGRWTVEVKSPRVPLDNAVWEQAHSYAAHPEIAATYFLITNGDTFRVYSMLSPKNAILEWRHHQEDEMWVSINNLLGPKNFKRRVKDERRHSGIVLADGLGTTARIVGGRIEYGEYSAEDPAQAAALQNFVGLRSIIEGEEVFRDEDGRITVRLKLAGPTAAWDQLNRLAGVEHFLFKTDDKYISSAPKAPTIFQGLTQFDAPAGTPIAGLPGLPPGMTSLPFSMKASAFTQATGYLSQKTFRGVYFMDYAIIVPPEVAQHLGRPSISLRGSGEFLLNVD